MLPHDTAAVRCRLRYAAAYAAPLLTRAVRLRTAIAAMPTHISIDTPFMNTATRLTRRRAAMRATPYTRARYVISPLIRAARRAPLPFVTPLTLISSYACFHAICCLDAAARLALFDCRADYADTVTDATQDYAPYYVIMLRHIDAALYYARLTPYAI